LLTKGYNISMYLVIQLWTAEDFIKEEVYLSISMEETGKQDYEELSLVELSTAPPQVLRFCACDA